MGEILGYDGKVRKSMETFEQKIAECINQKLNDGTIERIVEEKLEKGISEAIEGLFLYHGKAKEMLTDKFEEVIIPAIEQHDFNQYLVKLDSVLTEIINNTSVADNKVILDNFKRLMNSPAEIFSTVPISKIYDEWQNFVAENIDTDKLKINYDDMSYYNATTNMEIEKQGRKWFSHISTEYFIRFTCDEDEELNCEIKLSERASDEELRIDATTIPMDIHSLRSMSGFEVFIQQLMRAFVRVDLDITDSYGDSVEVKAEPEADFH